MCLVEAMADLCFVYAAEASFLGTEKGQPLMLSSNSFENIMVMP